MLRETLVARRRKRVDDADVSAPDDHPWLTEIEGRVPSVLKRVIDGLEKAGLALPARYRRLLRRLRPLPDGEDIRARTLPRKEQRARQLVLKLWGCVNRRLPPESDLVVESEGSGLRVFPPRYPWEGLQVAGEEVAASDTLSFKTVLFEGSSAERRFVAALQPPFIMAVHDLAWDLAVHAGTAKLPVAPRLSWKRWPGALCRPLAKVEVALWPAPAFETFLDVTAVCERWNHLVDTIRDLSSADPNVIIEFVAYAFIGSIVDVCYPRSKTAKSSESSEVEQNVGTSLEWNQLAVRIRKVTAGDPSVRPSLPRERAFAMWQRIWRVFAAPELGLPRRASEAILTSRLVRLSRQERDALRTARAQLCADAGIPLLDAPPEHPWVRLIEHQPLRHESA
jgi:hypothetical protein